MTRNVSTSDAKAKLSSYMEWAIQHPEGIIIHSHGKPKAALISYTAYEQFRVWQEEQRRQAALDELERLAEKLRSRNRDITGAEADEIADRFTREVIEEMVAEGKIKYRDEDA